MFSLIHLIFSLIKISILASIYALIVLFILKTVSKQKPQSLLAKLTSNGTRFWFGSGAIISFLLFFWLTSVSGNHGFGDSASIPIGYGKVVTKVITTHINPKGHGSEGYSIKSFAVKGKYCVGNRETDKIEYFIWDLESNEIQKISTQQQYEAKSKLLNLPSINEFKEFSANYKAHWHGWRFWLLP